MTADQFDEILNRRIQSMRTVLGHKALEYASRQDRLHNFKRAGAILGQTPHQTLLGFMAKHLVSILDIVEAREKGQYTPEPVIDEKIGDTINYLVLLEALLKE